MDKINQYKIEPIYITYCIICKCIQCLILVGMKYYYYGIALSILTQKNLSAQNILYSRKILETIPGLVAPNTQYCVEICTIRKLRHVIIPSCPSAQKTTSPVPICLPLKMWQWFGMMRQLRVQPRCTNSNWFNADTVEPKVASSSWTTTTFGGEGIWVWEMMLFLQMGNWE